MTKIAEKRYIFELTKTKIDQSTMLGELRTFIAFATVRALAGAGAPAGRIGTAADA